MGPGFLHQNSNLGMKITSGNIADIIGALPVGKYAGYYSSGATGTPSSYGTFEAVVMNNTTATITAIDTSNGANYTRVKTSNAWKDWERDITMAYRLSLESDKKYLVIYDVKTNAKLAHINTDAQF